MTAPVSAPKAGANNPSSSQSKGTVRKRRQKPTSAASEDDRELPAEDLKTDEQPHLGSNGSAGNGHMKYTVAPAGLRKDLGSIALLSCLYLLQGVPLGLTFGSIPFLLKAKLSYSEMAIFSLCGYPYSLKLFWSPVIDSIYFKSVGRRKSWIIPIQLLTGFVLFLIGTYIEEKLEQPTIDVNFLTSVFTLLVLLSATQDIAVDGWALELLSKENVEYGSTAQTIGMNTGYFLSFTVFLAFNSPEFVNKYIRSEPHPTGLISLGAYLRLWSLLFVIASLYVMTFREKQQEGIESSAEVYRTIVKICRMKNIQSLVIVLLLCKLAFLCNETVTALKLIELGLDRESLALAVLIDFPFQLVFGVLAARWSSGRRPLQPWMRAYYGRLVFAAVGSLVVYSFPKSGMTSSYLAVAIASSVLNSFMSTIMFVSLGCFFAKISDARVGGTYLTLLNTFANLGGTWAKPLVLKAVDYFTSATCTGLDRQDLGSCVHESERTLCAEKAGSCVTIRDGFYTVNAASCVVGALIFWAVIRPRILRIEQLAPSEWSVPGRDLDKQSED